MQIECEIVGFIEETYGKIEDWQLNGLVLMEFNEFYPHYLENLP